MNVIKDTTNPFLIEEYYSILCSIAVMGSFTNAASTPRMDAIASISHRHLVNNGNGRCLDFHTGERVLEISAMNAKDRGLKWSTQMQAVLSMRDKGQNRGPLWRGRVLSNEAMQTVQALKRAKADEAKIQKLFQTKVARLLKKDLMAVLAELQRQDECHLALRVFEAVRKEMWYKPDLSLYVDTMRALGRNKMIERVETLFTELKSEGLQPDTRVYTELLGAFMEVGLVQSAMETYEIMKQSGCGPDESTFTILIKGLERLGELELAAAVRMECTQCYIGSLDFLDSHKQEIVIC